MSAITPSFFASCHCETRLGGLECENVNYWYVIVCLVKFNVGVIVYDMRQGYVVVRACSLNNLIV